MTLTAVVQPVVEVLERMGVRYRIGGSVASSAHGSPRSTNDVDLVAELRSEHLPEFVQALSGSFLLFPELLQEAIDSRRCTNLIHRASGYKVDLFVRPEGPYDAISMQRTVERSLDPGGRAFKITSAEDILLAKLRWFRDGGELSERQWQDVLGILRLRERELDHAYLHDWSTALGVDDLLARAEREVLESGS